MSEKTAEEIVDNFTCEEVEEILIKILNGEMVDSAIQDMLTMKSLCLFNRNKI